MDAPALEQYMYGLGEDYMGGGAMVKSSRTARYPAVGSEMQILRYCLDALPASSSAEVNRSYST